MVLVGLRACSLVAEQPVCIRQMGVRFPPGPLANQNPSGHPGDEGSIPSWSTTVAPRDPLQSTMIYLIGGAPRCGKTILSKKIASKRKISWISTDTIRSMALACTPKRLINKKFPYQKLQFEKSDIPYNDLTRHSPATLLRAEITESKTIWPSTRAMIEHLIDSKQEYIIEGVHLMPALVRQLRGTKYWKHIKIVYLVKKDTEAILDGFRRNTSPHDWLAGAIKNKTLADRAANMVRTKSTYIARQAKKLQFKVVNIDNDFEKKINELIIY